MKKILTIGLAFSMALVMSGCSGSADNVTVSEGQSAISNNDDIIYSDTDKDFGYDYDDNHYNNDDIYSDTDEDFGYDNNYNGIQSINIYDIDEGSYTITGYNNRDEDVELNFSSYGGYEYSRNSEYFTGTFNILYGEIQMSDSQGGSYVLIAENDELVVGGSYFCDALGRELTITSITGGSLY